MSHSLHDGRDNYNAFLGPLVNLFAFLAVLWTEQDRLNCSVGLHIG